MIWFNWALLSISVGSLLYCWGTAVQSYRERLGWPLVALSVLMGSINLPFIVLRLSVMGLP